MLNVEIEKRYTIQQVKQHKWMRQLKELNDSYEINQTIGDLNRLDINFNGSLSGSFNEDEQLVEDCAQLASKFNLNPDELYASVRERKFDENYAFYHLCKDFGFNVESPSQTLPSSPLLPVIAAGQHRKSSITTGIVERENSSNSDEPIYDPSSQPHNANLLNAQATTHRRHTFGPESSSTTDTTKQQALFVTPPNVCLPNILLNSCDANQAVYPSTLNSAFPLKMDLLKPPQVFMVANNNMLRRASDGQANYYNQEHFHALNQVDSDCENENYSLNGSNSEIDNQQRMTPNQPGVYELAAANGNQFAAMYTLNDQQAGQASTPNSPLQFQAPNQSAFYPQQQLSNSTFQSPSSPVSYQRSANSPYSTDRLRKKRHSLTTEQELSNRRKHQAGGHPAASGGNLNASNNLNISSGFNLMPSNHSAQLPFYRDLSRRRASEGSGQLLQQLTPQLRPFETPFGPSNSAQRSLLGHLLANQLDAGNLNFHSNSSINQPQYKNQLCVSSPPSLTTSPIHQTTQLNHLQQSQPQAYQKSQSPPCQSLQMISEEQPTNLVFGTGKSEYENSFSSQNYEAGGELIEQQANDQQLYPQHGNGGAGMANGSLPCSPIAYPPFSAITPPQSFRSSTDDCLMSEEQQMILSRHLQQKLAPLNNAQGGYTQQQQAQQNYQQAGSRPSISVTNEFGCDIIPAPKAFQQFQEYPDAMLFKVQHDLREMNDHSMLYKQGSNDVALII